MPELNESADAEALRTLTLLYARAMDRGDAALLDAVLTEDVVVEGPGFRLVGLAEARRSPEMLRAMYLMTQHQVHNQTVKITGDAAEGETYCTATHVFRPEPGEPAGRALVWTLRYQDAFRRVGGAWRIARRGLIVDWSEVRPVTLGAGANANG